MRITGIETTVVGTPWRDLTFVEVMTEDGLTGVGEVRMHHRTRALVAAIDELADRHLIGQDPHDFERLAWMIGRADAEVLNDVTGSALAAFDVACYDLVGQASGVPVWQLLGGRFRDRVPAYANGWYRGRREPAVMRELAAAAVARGYTGLKIDPFGAGSVELTRAEARTAVKLLEAVRAEVGDDVALMVEMHARFAPAHAAELARLVTPVAPEWLEEPVPPENVAALRRVRQATHLPIATGEHAYHLADFRVLIEEGLADVLQADLTHFGGFTQMRKLAGWAEPYHVQLAPHNVCGPVGTAALVHFAVATPSVKVVEHFNDFDEPWLFDVVEGAPRIAPDGTFPVPTAPGLGVRLNHEACAAHPAQFADFNLFREGWERRA